MVCQRKSWSRKPAAAPTECAAPALSRICPISETLIAAASTIQERVMARRSQRPEARRPAGRRRALAGPGGRPDHLPHHALRLAVGREEGAADIFAEHAED